jgi:hypothetical protein
MGSLVKSYKHFLLRHIIAKWRCTVALSDQNTLFITLSPFVEAILADVAGRRRLKLQKNAFSRKKLLLHVLDYSV